MKFTLRGGVKRDVTKVKKESSRREKRKSDPTQKDRMAYLSNLSEAPWARLEPLISPEKSGERKR